MVTWLNHSARAYRSDVRSFQGVFVESEGPLHQHRLRINAPHQRLTPKQLSGIAGLIKRHSAQHFVVITPLKEIEAHEIEPANISKALRELEMLGLFDTHDEPVDRPLPLPTPHNGVTIELSSARLTLRQLLGIAVLMQREGLLYLHILDQHVAYLHAVPQKRERSLEIGLAEFGLRVLPRL